MNNIICTTAKNEHKYINDWVRYHIDLGFDHIFIIDNDDLNTKPIIKSIETSYQKYITIIDQRGQKFRKFQTEIYTKFYKEYQKSFTWCAFMDVDEYIQLNSWNNIKDMLEDSRFNNFEAIALIWHLFGDDGYLERDESIPVNNFFKKELINYPTYKKFLPQFGFCKSIIRGNLGNLSFQHIHFMLNETNKPCKLCTPDGLPFFNNVDPDIDARTEKFFNRYAQVSLQVYEKNTDAYIKHFMTKTLKEFIDQKCTRGDVQFTDRVIGLDYYWQINEPIDKHWLFWNNYITANKIKSYKISKKIYLGFMTKWLKLIGTSKLKHLKLYNYIINLQKQHKANPNTVYLYF